MNKKYYILFFFLLLVTGCKKSMDELNVNPNDALSANPDYLFTFSVTRGMGSYNTNVYVQYWMLMNWTMYLAQFGGVGAGSEYELNNGKDNLWTELYSQSLINAHEVIKFTKDNPALINKTSIAQIWEVYIFQQLTDLFGCIPYSDALNGAVNLNYSPRYDSQEDIYNSLIEELKSAAASLDVSKTTFAGNSDPIYHGSVAGWKAFSNSLRLRLALRLRYVNPGKAQQEVAALQNEMMISANTENAVFPFNGEIKNPLFELIQSGQSGGKTLPSKFLIDKLNATGDPRVKIFAQPTPESQFLGFTDYEGIPNLVPSNSPVWSNYQSNGWNNSTIGNWFIRQDAPGVLMSYSEICFLQSEAALLGWWSGDAQQLYESGIRANIESYGDSTITNSDINSYLATVPAVTLENIITQKWISFSYQNAYEAFAEYRRTGFPAFTNYDGTPINQAPFPVRFTYPPNEVSLNSDHYREALSIQGPDNVSTKLWWDKN